MILLFAPSLAALVVITVLCILPLFQFDKKG
jgi:hypothetical protein